MISTLQSRRWGWWRRSPRDCWQQQILSMKNRAASSRQLGKPTSKKLGLALQNTQQRKTTRQPFLKHYVAKHKWLWWCGVATVASRSACESTRLGLRVNLNGGSGGFNVPWMHPNDQACPKNRSIGRWLIIIVIKVCNFIVPSKNSLMFPWIRSFGRYYICKKK